MAEWSTDEAWEAVRYLHGVVRNRRALAQQYEQEAYEIRQRAERLASLLGAEKWDDLESEGWLEPGQADILTKDVE